MFCRTRLILALSSVALCTIGLPMTTQATIGAASQMLLGNPSAATTDPNNHGHYLIQRDIESLDYNDSLRQPNWASWLYTSGDSGSSGRSSSFYQDISLPAGFYQVLTTDYSGSGYDRGHMCPSADRTDSVAHNDETFLMSNMIPQAPDNNQGVWANLETYSRAIGASNEVLVICGPQGFGTNRTASAGQIPIASNVWKIIVAVPLGAGPTLSRITNSTRVIAVNIPNIQGVRTDPWQNYLTSVHQLQTNTGFSFFTALNSNVAAVLRAKVDGSPACGITNVTPLTGTANSSVVLRGTNFTGVTTVMFNGAPASFSVNSPTQITTTVPTTATSGRISLLAAGGLATSSSTFSVNNLIVIQPALTLSHTSSNLVISWASAATSYSLQQTADLNPANWSLYPGPITDNGTTKSATLTPTNGQLFFRLIAPVP